MRGMICRKTSKRSLRTMTLAEVLASVPGTPEAEDAVLLAQVPTTAVVKRAGAQAQAKVEYNGAPQFAPIEGTTLSYATNADADVIRVEQLYYLCLNAIWFSSSSPTGPWTVVSAVPEVIYTIPPSSPVYHVTYVKVEGSTPEEVTCSYTAGYSGAYIAGAAAGAALVWGTGYYYPPYIYPGTVPVYRPYYATYGVAAAYYPYSGAYAVGGYAYGPYASAGRAAWYNPQTGAYGTSLHHPISVRRTNLRVGLQSQHRHSMDHPTRARVLFPVGHLNGDAWRRNLPGGARRRRTTVVRRSPKVLTMCTPGMTGTFIKKTITADWSKWDNGGWQPVNTAGQLSSQNKETGRQNSKGGTKDQGTLGGTSNQPSANGQTNAENRKGQGKRGQNNQSQAATTNKKSSQTSRRQENESCGTRGTTAAGSKGEGSNDLTSGLDREASARQRGSQNVNLQQRSSTERRHTFPRFGRRAPIERFQRKRPSPGLEGVDVPRIVPADLRLSTSCGARKRVRCANDVQRIENLGQKRWTLCAYLPASLLCFALSRLRFFPGVRSPDRQRPISVLRKFLSPMSSRQDVPVVREWIGSLDGSVNADIRARVSGYLVSQNYKEGTLVHQGDPLFQIDSSTYEAAVEQAKSALAQSEANQLQAEQTEKRETQLFEQKVESAQNRDNAVQANVAAKAEVKAQQAALRQAELNLQFTKIIAPVTGIAGIANPGIGDLVGPSDAQPLMTMSTVDPIKAYLKISEQDYLKFARRVEQARSGRGTGASGRNHSCRWDVVSSSRKIFGRRPGGGSADRHDPARCLVS